MFLRCVNLERNFPLPDGRMVIGRSSKECDIVIGTTDNKVSRKHAELRIYGDRVKIRDLRSHNQTLLNDTPISPLQWHLLNLGDRIKICDYVFELAADSGSCIVDNDSSVSTGMAISLSNYKPISEPQIQLKGLLTISRALQDILNIDELAAKSIEVLFEVFPRAKRVAIGLVDERAFEAIRSKVRGGSGQEIVRLSKTVISHVIERSEAVCYGNPQGIFVNAKSILLQRVGSIMCAPMLAAEGQVLGLVYVDAGETDCFHDRDLELLVAVSTLISLAVRFSQLHSVAIEGAEVCRNVEDAREVQQAYLPESVPTIEGYDLAGFYRPAMFIGGDYYDYIPLPDGRLAIVLGDVVGKGVPAALTMVRLATETRSSLEVCTTPAAMLSRLNQRLPQSFITLVVLMLDPKSHTVSIGKAGHDPPLLRLASGEVQTIDVKGCPLTVMEDGEYADTLVELQPGDSLTVYSDGFPDAESSALKRFGKDRVRQELLKPYQSSQQMVDRIVDSADQFIGDHPQFDDMCLLHLLRKWD